MNLFSRLRFSAFMFTLALVCFSLSARAQSATNQPDFFIAAGAGFNQYAGPDAAHTAGWLSAAHRIADRTYTLAAIDQTPKRATMRAGVAYMLSQRGPVSIFALGDAGAAMGSATNFAATGGGMVTVSLESQLKYPLYIVGSIRVMQIGGSAPGGGVAPVYEFGVGYGQ